MAKYIITGGAGFIGCRMAHALNQKGESDILIVDRLRNGEKWRNLLGIEYADYMDKDEFIEQVEIDPRFLKGTECILHMGACSSTTQWDADYLMENNYEYTKILSKHCIERGIRFIYASSAATYGDGAQGYSDECDLKTLRPLNPYGFSKSTFDLWAERNQMLDKIVGLKFFNVYGPGEAHKGEQRSVVHKSYGQIQDGGQVKLFRSHREGYEDGEQLRDFIYVEDTVKVALFFAEHPKKNGVFNVGTGKARSFKDLALATYKAMEVEPNIVYIDMPEEIREKYQYFTEATMNKLRSIGYTEEFFSLEDGVQDYINHLKS